MGRSKQKARSSSHGYTNTKQLANMINNGVKNAKKIKYDLSHETCFYEHYFSYSKNQDQCIAQEITADYVPFITMAVTTNDKNNPFPRVVNDKTKIIDSSNDTLVSSLDTLLNFVENYGNFEEKKEMKSEEKYESKTDEKVDESERKTEYWLGWHETSKYDGRYGMVKYGRPSLMLVFVLDISGSMGSPFKAQGFQYASSNQTKTSMNKIQIAKKVLIKFLDQLQGNDYFGLCVFNNDTEVIHAIEQWKNTNVEEVIAKINKLESGGGTVITTAYSRAVKMLLDCPASQLKSYEKRLFFLTDMEVSSQEGNEYTKLVAQFAADKSVYSSVTGIGLDLSSGVITRLSSTIGCNYSNVLSFDDFIEIINYEFSYMVTPIATNVQLSILSDHEFAGGYGSFEVRNVANSKNKKVCQQITRFPSQCNYRGERRSGVILLKLQSMAVEKNKVVRLKISFNDVYGDKKEIFFKKDFNEMRINEAENNGIKKAILLKNYVDFIQFYLKLRLKYSPSKQEIEIFKKWNVSKFHHYFDYMIRNLMELNDVTLMEELKILRWIGGHDNIKFTDSIDKCLNNVKFWDNLCFCPSEQILPALFPNAIKIINNGSQMESLIIGFLRDSYSKYDDSKVSKDILKIFALYLLPIIWSGDQKK